MFLNRKLIVQLSTSRFRPQPKESNTPISPTPQQLMIMNGPLSSSSPPIPYHHATGGSKTQQQSTPQYHYPDLNYEMMTSTHSRLQSSSSPIPDNSNMFRPPSPLSQDMSNYYSQYSNIPLDRMTPSATTKLNHMKLNKMMKTGKSNAMA